MLAGSKGWVGSPLGSGLVYIHLALLFMNDDYAFGLYGDNVIIVP